MLTVTKYLLYFAVIYTIITYLWQMFELKLMGDINVNPIHTVVTIILSLSLLLNYLVFKHASWNLK